MKKNKLVVVALLLISSACSKSPVVQKTSPFDEEKSLIASEISKHSEGLDFYFEALEKKSLIKTKSGSNIANEILSDNESNEQFLLETVSSFLKEKGLGDNVMDIVKSNLKSNSIKTKSTNTKKATYSYNFYKMANDILNISHASVTDTREALDKIYDSPNFQKLSKIEQQIILIEGETYFDSYQYWDKNIDKWNNLFEQINPKYKHIKTKGWWDTVKQYAKVDAKGAVSGAVGGAVGGAIVGSMAGGVGAIPGATTGAVGGAVGGAVTASIDEALSAMTDQSLESIIVDSHKLVEFIDEDGTILFIDIPTSWIL